MSFIVSSSLSMSVQNVQQYMSVQNIQSVQITSNTNSLGGNRLTTDTQVIDNRNNKSCHQQEIRSKAKQGNILDGIQESKGVGSR